MEPPRFRVSPGKSSDIFIAMECDFVDGRYRVVHISTRAVEVQDLFNNNRQHILMQSASAVEIFRPRSTSIMRRLRHGADSRKDLRSAGFGSLLVAVGT